jgi:hypothetical protein
MNKTKKSTPLNTETQRLGEKTEKTDAFLCFAIFSVPLRLCVERFSRSFFSGVHRSSQRVLTGGGGYKAAVSNTHTPLFLIKISSIAHKNNSRQ